MQSTLPLIETNENPLRDPKWEALLKRHFWCDFSDIIPSMAWDDKEPKN